MSHRRPSRRWRPPLYVRSSLSIEVSEPSPEESPPEIDTANAHPQTQSPLFGILPAELRNTIFDLALAQYEDMSAPYSPEDYCYRPGYRAKRRVSLSLLRTCRAVYAETRRVPCLSEYELTLWCGDVGRAPPDSSEQCVDAVSILSCPKGPWSEAHQQLQQHPSVYSSSKSSEEEEMEEHRPPPPPPGRLHLFAQLWWVEQNRMSPLFKSWKIASRTITLTIRHTDWWYWESDTPLRLDRGWVDRLKLPDTVEEFDLELETVERKKGQLDAIVGKAKLWPMARRDGVVLSAEACVPSVFRWVGSRKIRGRYHSEQVSDEGLPYYVVTLQWRLQGAV